MLPDMRWFPALAASFLLLIGTQLRAADLPSADELVLKVLARDEAQQTALTHYQYHQKVATDWLNPDGTVRHGSELEMIVHPGEAGDFSIVADGKGGVLSPDQTSDKERKEARDSEKLKANFSLRELASRFEIKVSGPETLRGQSAYILAFSPRPGQPYTNRIEKVLNNLTGKMWVSTDDYGILQTEAHLAKPVDMAWVFATMKELDFRFEAEPIPGAEPALLAPAEFDLDFRVDVTIREVRQRQRISMDDYQSK